LVKAACQPIPAMEGRPHATVMKNYFGSKKELNLADAE
jgi:hypothetical protein